MLKVRSKVTVGTPAGPATVERLTRHEFAVAGPFGDDLVRRASDGTLEGDADTVAIVRQAVREARLAAEDLIPLGLQ